MTDINGKKQHVDIAAELGSNGRRVPVQAGLLEHGAERARQSGALDPRTEDVDALGEHAVAMARDAHRPPYRPDENPNDRLREDRFTHNMARRRTLAEAEEHAELALRDAEAEQARVPAPGARPEVPVLLAAGAVFVLALTVTATLRDFLFSAIEDDALAWGLSLAMSLGFGLFLAYSALGAQGGGSDEHPAERGRAVIVGGVIVALALGAWRASGAEGVADLLTAAALTGLEIGVIVILEWTGSRHEVVTSRWHGRADARAAVDAAVTASEANLERRRKELAKVEEAIEEHVAYVEDRTFRSLAIEELSKAATTAVKDGYNKGIAENRGRIRGSRR